MTVPRPARRAVAWGAALALALLALAVTRVVASSRTELAAAEQALARGERVLALDAFERAARMSIPGLRSARRALERLEELGDGAAAAGDEAGARAAYEAARRAILGRRALGVPEPARLERINARLAALLARADRDPSDEATRRQWHAARLAQSDAPRAGFALLAVLGFALWVGGGVTLALRPARARYWAALAVGGGLALWLLGVWRA